jgi:trehalose 6-phosphate phosphatase
MLSPFQPDVLPSGLDSAFGVLSSLTKQLARDDTTRLVIAVDYDGTLTPIVSNPTEAYLNPAVRTTLVGLSSLDNVHVIISSGRSRTALENFVTLSPTPQSEAARWGGLSYSTSHGFLIDGPFGVVDKASHSASALQAAEAQISRAVKEAGDSLLGVTIEIAPACITAHFRNAIENTTAERSLDHIFNAAAAAHGLERRSAKKAFELRGRPVASEGATWNKGSALNWILTQLVDKEGPPVVLLTIGDDETDEDLFAAAKTAATLGQVANAWSVRVFGPNDEHPTLATLSLKDPKEVATLLDAVLVKMGGRKIINPLETAFLQRNPYIDTQL